MECVSASRTADSTSTAEVRRRETVVLLHGSGGSGSLWRHTSAALKPLYRCLAPDLLGYGTSPAWPAGVAFGLDAERLALEPRLNCCTDRLHVVGYSYGGVVALHLALARPGRVHTLALIEPVFFHALAYASHWRAFSHFQHVRDEFLRGLEKGNREAALGSFVDFWSGNGTWGGLSAAARQDLLRHADKIALDWQAAFAFQPDRGALESLGQRTLLIRGDCSPTPMLELVDALNGLMPGSTRVIVNGANHLVPLTHATQLTGAILTHLHVDAERTMR